MGGCPLYKFRKRLSQSRPEFGWQNGEARHRQIVYIKGRGEGGNGLSVQELEQIARRDDSNLVIQKGVLTA